ncbi:MAG: hypothetical protein ABMA13_17440 [Chthoniobacteraceae bacterium]
MTQDQQREIVKRMLEGYKFLEQERRERVRQTDTARELSAFDGMALAALTRFPPEPTSGLIEQQRLFRRMRAMSTPSVNER